MVGDPARTARVTRGSRMPSDLRAWQALALVACSTVASCGSSLTGQDTERLHNAQADLVAANGGHLPENNAHIAYCQIHAVLAAANQAADPDSGSLPCPDGGAPSGTTSAEAGGPLASTGTGDSGAGSR